MVRLTTSCSITVPHQKTQFTLSVIRTNQPLDIDKIRTAMANCKLAATSHQSLSIVRDAHTTFCEQFKCELAPELDQRATINTLRNLLNTPLNIESIDVVLHDPRHLDPEPRLVCFDMDSTLIHAEVIDELAKEAGVGDQVCDITARAMHGELNFVESFTARMKLLKGLHSDKLEQVASTLPIMPGAAHLFEKLNKAGVKTAILSGGFDYFARQLQTRFKVDYVYANKLDIQDGTLTGNTITPIVDGVYKENRLKGIAQELGIPISNTIAVGDGANDLPMIHTAGLGIAYHAKPAVIESAPNSIQHSGLDSLLFLLGLS